MNDAGLVFLVGILVGVLGTLLVMVGVLAAWGVALLNSIGGTL
jgi:hypothetical protein